MSALEVDGIVSLDARQVDDVLEVPTHENIDMIQRGDRNVLRVDDLPSSHDAGRQVFLSQGGGHLCQLHLLAVALWNPVEDSLDRKRCAGELEERQIRDDEDLASSGESVDE